MKDIEPQIVLIITCCRLDCSCVCHGWSLEACFKHVIFSRAISVLICTHSLLVAQHPFCFIVVISPTMVLDNEDNHGLPEVGSYGTCRSGWPDQCKLGIQTAL
jgi:hypothetical protein